VLRDAGVAAYSMHEVDKYGIARVVQMALARVNPGMAAWPTFSILDPHSSGSHVVQVCPVPFI
jgi:hypothetical protein